jgi:hypothetical protein
MKQKPDETLDHWVRQSLSQLPDAPPPGSSFDPEHLWAQLRPDVQAAPARRRMGWAWWVVAACLAGLTVSWFLQPKPANNKAVIAHGTRRNTNAQMEHRQKSDPVAEMAVARPVFSRKRPVPEPIIATNHKETPIQQVTPSPEQVIEANPQTPELSTVADVTPITEKLPEPKPNVAVIAPKHQFRVVHENELRAEEEARPKLYRTEHFVRVGTGRREETGPEEQRPTLIMSLTNKPNQ